MLQLCITFLAITIASSGIGLKLVHAARKMCRDFCAIQILHDCSRQFAEPVLAASLTAKLLHVCSTLALAQGKTRALDTIAIPFGVGTYASAMIHHLQVLPVHSTLPDFQAKNALLPATQIVN